MCSATATSASANATSSSNGDDAKSRHGQENGSTTTTTKHDPSSDATVKNVNNDTTMNTRQLRRRSKREKEGEYTTLIQQNQQQSPFAKKKRKKSSKAFAKHGKDSPSGGLEALLPSLAGVAILIFAVLAQRGFRGRATVAGIDLGTTNSVLCIQAPSKGVGEISCVPDSNGSPIVPSVVSFLEPHERPVGPSSKKPSLLSPHPSHVVVGYQAKPRIDSHSHHTLYHAKRVLGRLFSDDAVQELRHEVDFIVSKDENAQVVFDIDHQYHLLPQQVGGYVVHHLLQLAQQFLGHDQINAAVICVPAKFTPYQRQLTAQAFTLAGLQVARILEEPTAAALAYGLHLKPNVEKILVYDFGGGTLDISILHVAEGFVDVMGSDGDDRLGGADFDVAIAQHLKTQQQQHGNGVLYIDDNDESQHEKLDVEAFISSCSRITDDLPLCSISSFHTMGEAMKIQLSSSNDTAVESQCWALSRDNNKNNNSMETICESLILQTLSLSLEEYNTICQPLFDRSILPIGRLLHDLTLEPSDIDEVVMVGGTTRMPQIRTLVQEQFPHIDALNTHIDPDLTVAYGAASVID
jgi:molecular chaperone DnaK (HSP70)